MTTHLKKSRIIIYYLPYKKKNSKLPSFGLFSSSYKKFTSDSSFWHSEFK